MCTSLLYLDAQNRAYLGRTHYDAVQAGAGIANAGLPASDTSVDRFIRAAYYALFVGNPS